MKRRSYPSCSKNLNFVHQKMWETKGKIFCAFKCYIQEGKLVKSLSTDAWHKHRDKIKRAQQNCVTSKILKKKKEKAEWLLNKKEK